VDDDPRLVTTATLVALTAGVLAFFALTDRGRDALRRVGPALDDVSHTLHEVRTIVQKIDRVVQEANAMVTDIRDVMPSINIDDDLDSPPYGA
jgi:hypothetical protein